VHQNPSLGLIAAVTCWPPTIRTVLIEIKRGFGLTVGANSQGGGASLSAYTFV
jgi:hypothetical protein